MYSQFALKKQRFPIGFIAGLAAGMLATGLMLLLSTLAGSVSLPEALGSAIVQTMPAPVFAYLHSLIGDNAKHYFFYAIVIGQCLVFALAGGFCTLLADPKRFANWYDEQGLLRWPIGVGVAIVLWLFTGLVFLPLVGAGIFGAALPISVVNTLGSLALIALVFGLLFVYARNWLVLQRVNGQATEQTEGQERENQTQRRTLVRNGVILLGLGALGVAAWRFITAPGSEATAGISASSLLQQYKNKINPVPVPNYGTITPITGLTAEVTPLDQFYVVSKNFVSDPVVDGKSWNMSIDGLVDHPFSLNYNQLTSMPLQKQAESMMCISNEVGGNLMSNANWEGVPLANLLQKAGVKKGATKVVLHAADSYSDSIHLAKALEPTTLVAVHMDGAQLATGHGYPARLLVPGIYGMKHVKWITHIEVVDTDFQGYWQQSGWSDAAPIRLTSRIDVPQSSDVLAVNKPTYVAGVAFSGNKGISEVDVSFDGGNTWQRATLKQPSSDLTWVIWQASWQPSKAGSQTITVRAIDKEGNVQDPQQATPAPNGSSGYHSIAVNVS